jgi:hypothetical protein
MIIDGGVGIARKLYVGTDLAVTGTTLLAGETTVNTGIIPDASDGAYLGTSSLEFSDLFLADAAVIALGDGGADVTLTHYADNGLLLNSTNKIYFEDGGNYDQYIGSKTATGGITIVNSPTEIELVTPLLDIDASGEVTIQSPAIKLETAVLSLNEPAAAAAPGRLVLYEATDNGGDDTYISIEAGNVNNALTTAIQLIMPIEPPTEGQVLKSHGISSLKHQLFWAADNSTAAGAVDINLLGTGSGNNDVVLRFDGTSSNDVELKWYHNGGTGYLGIDKPARMAGTTKLEFRNTDISISSSADNKLDLMSDGVIKLTSGGDIELESKAGIILTIDDDSNTDNVLSIFGEGQEVAQFNEAGKLQLDDDIQIDGNTVTFGNGATIENTSSSLLTITEATTALSGALTVGGGYGATGTTISDAGVFQTNGAGTFGGIVTATGLTAGSAVLEEAELEILDDATVNTAELNIMDGSATVQDNVVLAAGDGVVISDGDVMKQALVEDFATYISSNITNGTVSLDDVVNINANSILGRNANSSGALSQIALATTQILIGDGTGFTAAALSGDATMTNGGAVTIADNAVSLAKMAGITRGSIIIGDSGGDPAYLDAKGNTKILVGDGTDLASVTVSGDATLANTGALTIANDAVTLAMMNDIARGSIIVGGGSDAPTAYNAKTAGQILVGDNTDLLSVAVSGDATLAANGALTIAATSVENSMLADDAVGVDELAANAVVNASVDASAAIATSKLSGAVTSIASHGLAATATSTDAANLSGTLAAARMAAAQTAITSVKHNDLVIGGNAQNNTIDFGTDDQILFDIDNTEKFKITADGIDISGTTQTNGGAFVASDQRYKKNITPVTGALEKLSKLNPVNYDLRTDEFKERGFSDKKQWGFIAQEIEKVMPELVIETRNGYLGLNYTGVIPLLTKAMQEQQTEMEKQQKEIDELKAQLQSIMKMLDNDMSDKTDDKKADDNKKPVKLSMATVK